MMQPNNPLSPVSGPGISQAELDKLCVGEEDVSDDLLDPSMDALEQDEEAIHKQRSVEASSKESSNEDAPRRRIVMHL